MRALVLGSLSALAVACGGIAFIDQPTGGSAGAAGSAGTGGTAGSGGIGGIGGIGGSSCAGLGEVGCVAAFPDCVPRYDDTCCPTCYPGPCADCSNWAFYECVDGSACSQPNDCGVIPVWACNGVPADCPNGQPCGYTPGCIELSCGEGDPCPGTFICAPVTGDMCIVQCDGVPPDCPPGTAPQSDGFCYTGYCVPAEYCAIPL
jgi:hypothetical protein